MLDSLEFNEKFKIVDVIFKMCIQKFNFVLIMVYIRELEEVIVIYFYMILIIKIVFIVEGEFSFSVDNMF